MASSLVDLDRWDLIFEKLLAKNPCRNGQVPMHIAAMTGQTEMFQKLSYSAMDKNPKDDIGRTPLHLAAKNGHLSICQLIISDEGKVPRNLDLIMLEFKGSRHKRFSLYPSMYKNPMDENGWTPFHLAAKHGHEEVCQLIMENIPEINPPGCNSKATPLHLAAWNGHLSICKMIIEKIPDKSVKHVNLKDGIDNTPLHLAAERGHFEVCELIMHSMVDVPKGYGLRPEVGPKSGPDRDQTPYFLASFNGHKSVCNLLQWFPMYHPRLEKMKSHAESMFIFNLGNKYGDKFEKEYPRKEDNNFDHVGGVDCDCSICKVDPEEDESEEDDTQDYDSEDGGTDEYLSDTEDDESEEEDTRDEYEKAMDKAEDYMQEKQGRALMEKYPDLISKLQKPKGDNTEKADSRTRGDSRIKKLDLDVMAKALEIRRSDLGKITGKIIKNIPK